MTPSSLSTSTSINDMPPELFMRTLELGVEEWQDCDDFHHRYSFLRMTSLVSRDWRILSQAVMWDRVFLKDNRSARLLIDSLKTPTTRSHSHPTRYLTTFARPWPYDGGGVRSDLICWVLELLKVGKTLSLMDLGDAEAMPLNVFAEPNLKDLNSLELYNVFLDRGHDLVPIPASFALHTLSMAHTISSSPTPFSYFSSANLRKLDLDRMSDLDHYQINDLVTLIKSTAAYLEDLSLQRSPHILDLLIPQLSTFRSLRRLVIGSHSIEEWRSIATSISCPLSSLSLNLVEPTAHIDRMELANCFKEVFESGCLRPGGEIKTIGTAHRLMGDEIVCDVVKFAVSKGSRFRYQKRYQTSDF